MPTTLAPDTSAAEAMVSISRDQLERLQAQLKFAQTRIAALNFEIARLKRWRFGSSSESLDAQAPLFQEILADAALEEQAARDEQQGRGGKSDDKDEKKRRPVRSALPENLPRIDHHHELTDTHCACGQPLVRIGEDVSEQLDCEPARFFVHRHIRGKYACRCCQTIQAAALPPQIIDKGLPAAGLLAQVAVAKVDDHLPFYRQNEIYARSNVHIPRSSMAQWSGICGVRLAPLADALREHVLTHSVIHADETPVSLLAPGKGKTHRAYVWVYRTTDFAAQPGVWFDFCTSRAGEHPRRVLGAYAGTVVTDDYAGYKALYAQGRIVEAGCMAHARRKLYEAHELNGSEIAGHAVTLMAKLYVIEREIKELGEVDAATRLQIRQQRARPVADELHEWLTTQRQRLTASDTTAKAIDYSLGRWRALTRYLQDGEVPIDNNAVENSIRPLALGVIGCSSARATPGSAPPTS